MAGIIKRSNKWVAVFKTLDGKEVRKTTRIDVVPKVIPPGANKRAVIAQNEARAPENKKVNDTDYIKHKQHRAHSPEFFSIYLLQNITPVRTGLQLYASPLFCQEACLHTLPLTSSEVH